MTTSENEDLFIVIVVSVMAGGVIAMMINAEKQTKLKGYPRYESSRHVDSPASSKRWDLKGSITDDPNVEKTKETTGIKYLLKRINKEGGGKILDNKDVFDAGNLKVVFGNSDNGLDQANYTKTNEIYCENDLFFKLTTDDKTGFRDFVLERKDDGSKFIQLTVYEKKEGGKKKTKRRHITMKKKDNSK